MKYKGFLKTGVAAGVLLGTLGNAPAFAQSSQFAALEEITVTAQKRETSLQDTAVAISVLNSDQLSKNGIKDLRDMATHIPGISLSADGISTVVTMRGVSSRDTTEIGDPAVAISLDGFYYQRVKGLNDAMFDLERVEVMRGPQGTLYGRNATAGAINFVTAKPKDEFEAKASVGYGNYQALTTEGMINVPVTDKIKVRAAFATNSRNGYRTNEAPAEPGDDAGSSAARLQVLFDPTDELSVLLTAGYSKIKAVGPTYLGIPIGPGGIVNDVMPELDSKGSFHGLPQQRLDSETKYIQWNVKYDFGIAELSYLGGKREQDIKHLRDLDGTEAGSFYFDTDEVVDDLIQEVRLASTGESPFEWMVGGFYFKSKNDLASLFQDWSVANAPANLFQFIYPDIEAESKSAFAQIGYQLTNEFKVEGGIRYSEDTKHRRGYNNYGGGDLPVDASSESNKTTYHFAINYDLNEDSMLYAKMGTGYKAGGFTDVAQYGPESITAYEIGSKNRFLDNKLEVNLTGFYYDYKDQQISQFKDGVTTVFNAGKSEIYGVELEWKALVAENGRFDGFVSYLHAEFTEFCTSVINDACAAGSDFAGNKPPQSPSWQLMAGYEHDFELPGGILTARAQSRFESSSYLAYTNFVREQQDSYIRSDVMLTYTNGNEDWSVQAYIRNIEDTDVITYASASGLWGAYNYTFAAPRTYGVNFTVNW